MEDEFTNCIVVPSHTLSETKFGIGFGKTSTCCITVSLQPKGVSAMAVTLNIPAVV